MRNVSYAQAVTQGIKKNMVSQENRAVHSDNKNKFKAMGLNIYLGISLFMNSVGPFGLSGMGLSYRIFRPKVLGPVSSMAVYSTSSLCHFCCLLWFCSPPQYLVSYFLLGPWVASFCAQYLLAQ